MTPGELRQGEEDKLILVVKSESSGFEGFNKAKITLNGFQVLMTKNSSGHYRGLHIVIFNPYNGIVESA